MQKDPRIIEAIRLQQDIHFQLFEYLFGKDKRWEHLTKEEKDVFYRIRHEVVLLCSGFKN